MNSPSSPERKSWLRLPFGRPNRSSGEPTPGSPDSPPPELLLEPGWLPPLDLLRERRQELDRKAISGVLLSRPRLIRGGITIGGLILGASVAVCALLFVSQQFLKARVSELEGFEMESKELSLSLEAQGQALQRLKNSNEQMVRRLSDVRSSSALLADLQLRVPAGVQITDVKMVSPTEMQLNGHARDPVAFGRVNAMELVLRRSPLFLAKGVTIAKAERMPARQIQIQNKDNQRADKGIINMELPSFVEFELKATLSPLAPAKLAAVMDALNAEGLSRRLNLLQREGLLP